MNRLRIRDASFAPIANGEYPLFIANLNNALNSIFILRISIYTVSDGSIFAKDNNGNDINNKLITSMSYAYPYIVSDTGQYVDGTMTLTFDDYSTFTNTDENNTAFWYSIDGYNNNVITQYT